jgi:hypothetical protein
LLKRVFDIDLEHCPRCGGPLKIIAAIEHPPSLRRSSVTSACPPGHRLNVHIDKIKALEFGMVGPKAWKVEAVDICDLRAISDLQGLVKRADLQALTDEILPGEDASPVADLKSSVDQSPPDIRAGGTLQ